MSLGRAIEKVHRPRSRWLFERVAELVRTRLRLKVALVRSWSATTGGLSRFESELRCVAQDSAQRRLELPPLVVRSADGRSIISSGRSLVLEASKRFIREVPEAHILPPGGIILSRNRRFVTENVYGDEEAALRHAALSTFVRSFSPAKSQLGVVFSLLGPYSHNYFHWLTQHLPRVEDFLLWRTVSAPNAKLLLAPGPWQIRFLELLGVGREFCVNYPINHATAELAAVASHPGYSKIALPATPERLTWLRSRILAGLELKGRPGTRRLFISRRDSIRRPIANEEEISRALEAWGFETVVLRNLEIDDQVRLFAAAGVVVAVHGAGLANLVFSTAPTVIELFAADWVRPDFQGFQPLSTLFTGGRHVGVSLQGSLQSGLRADVEGLLRVLAEELGE